MNKQTIPVFFSIDDNYAPYLSVALASAIKNSSKQRSYKAIVLYEELSEQNKACLSQLSEEHFSIEFVAMKSGLESITDKMSNRLRCDYFTLTIYFRLFIPAMFPQYDKGIYIDSDVVIADDLAKLFDTDIGDNFIGACSDKSVADVPPLVNYMQNAVGVKSENYINSGVLLMNLRQLRKKELDKHFLSLLTTYQFDCIAPDQDYLNALCAGRIYYLDERWDAMPSENAPLQNPAIIHYNLFSKPWCYDGIQYGDVFWQYAENSLYYNEIKAYKSGYSQQKKDADAQCLKLLVERGEQICQNEVTFKKLFESGVKIRL